MDEEKPPDTSPQEAEPSAQEPVPAPPDLSSLEPGPVPPDLSSQEPAAIPPAFQPSILRAVSVQQSKGRGVGATIAPAELDVELGGEDTSQRIPLEVLHRAGRQVRFNEAGEVEVGEPTSPAGFEVMHVLGRGGMGVVCLARQEALGRDVALKVARKAKSDEAGTTGMELEMFTNEAFITASLEHPHIVPVHTLCRDATGRLFFTMKRVTGVSWEHLLEPALVRNRAERERVEARAAAMGLEEHLEILLKVCDAVAYAHSRGVLHRDLKPENVMIGDYGEVLVMDWGLAMPFGERNPYVLDPKKAAQLVGTPAYVAPEMARGEMTRFGPPTDVYLLGGILYQLLTGHPPHFGAGIMEAVRQAAAGKLVKPEDVPGVKPFSPELGRIAVRALQARMQDRYPNVEALVLELKAYRRHEESLAASRRAREVLAQVQARAARGDPENPRLEKLTPEWAAMVYGRLSECIGAFRQSIQMWAGNAEAHTGLLHALLLQIKLALERGDLTLARSRLELLDLSAQESEDPAFRERVRAHRARLGQAVEARGREAAALKRRVKVVRYLVLSLIAVLAGAIAGGFYLISEQKSLVLDNLKAIEGQRQLAWENQRAADRAHRQMIGSSVRAQAELVDRYLLDLEALVGQHRLAAQALLGMPAELLPPRGRTPAGRAGYYLDEDYRAPGTRPPDFGPQPGHAQPLSLSEGTLKLAPWATAGAARAQALEDARRLARLSPQIEGVLRTRTDVPYTVFGTRSGVMLTFPGYSRFADKPEYDPTRRPWYLAGLGLPDARPTWTDPHVDASGRGLLLTCVAFLEVAGERRGVVGLELSLETLQDMLVRFVEGAGQGGRGLLVRDDGSVVVDTAYAADRRRWQERFEVARVGELGEAVEAYWRGALAGSADARMAVELETSLGPSLLGHARIARLGWTLLVVLPSSGTAGSGPELPGSTGAAPSGPAGAGAAPSGSPGEAAPGPPGG
ncbi:MAG TPA: serine/threonine protein kinase [Myxococcota bacterium]|nr:serine/threonine protein kinase [Myxococcota bacterium]HRY94620.1 serine/threonine protein kinase [Myxococcota bacterium]HSA20224.1 serine/threonine protein kinase [Myxococcota bacterium]